MTLRLLGISVALLLALRSAVVAQEAPDAVALDAAVVAEIERVLDRGVDPTATESVYWNAVRLHGDVDELVAWLDEAAADAGDDARSQALRLLAVHVHSRRGDLGLALDLLSALVEEAPGDLDLVLWKARLHDSLGEIESAKTHYKAVLEATDDLEVKRAVHLRLALMEPAPAEAATEDEERPRSPLAVFASEQGDAAIRNRAAIVLAVMGRPAEALDLFVAAGEGTRRFRAESRRAEWGLRAEDPERAREAAWLAVKAAELRRDRRYALTLLVEAYRADDTLADLIDRLASADTLTSEERELWIDQLREQSRYDEAIELFRSGADGNLTRPMRRELLEMEREAGHEDRMIAEYEALIAREPGEVIWRTGLTQLLLERGDEDAAAALWPDYIATLATGGPLLESLAAQVSLGLDDLAVATVDRMLELDVDSGEALLALARMHRDRGRLPEAEAALDRLNASVDASDSVRFELAESYEQLGRQRRAVEVMEGVRGQRETVAEDLEMRLAWLYSEISEEKQALALWKQLWQRVNSVPRRRYVEDRLMSVASRLGSLADIAIDLEEKLIEGTADERDVGLLVRIYTRVNDPVSATEVLGDFMRQSGGSEIDVLAEESRIYLVCTDYHNYEKTIRRMIDVDPEGEGDYLRQLAMSQLERGRPDQARDVLMQLRDIETDSVSREFEGGVLTLAGMHEEACVAYRKGVAEHPDRIESYLLLADLMRTLGQTPRAVGMFQYLAETAERDDLFTIAIDGLLNMEADGATIQWARRITLERLAGREDKNYLYQLLHDLAEESGDKPAQIRALENSIAVAGTRRLSVLRECMDLSSRVRGGVFYAPGQNGPTNAGNEPFYAFARRLIGLEEAVPPGVFLDLGQAFLADDNVRSAWQTFSLARNLPDERGYRRQVAGIFETSGHRREALRVYERLLRTSPSDVGLIAKVAQLHEQEGRDVEACRFYERALDLLMSQAPIATASRNTGPARNTGYMWARNRDTFQTYYDRVIRGLLVTLADAAAVDAIVTRQRAALEADLALLDARDADEAPVKSLNAAPRVQRRAAMLRRLFIAFDRIDEADAMDQALLARFIDDNELLGTLARARADWGYFGSARGLASYAKDEEQALRRIRVITGEEYDELATSPIEPAKAMRQVLPLLAAGNRDAARSLLRRVNMTNLRSGNRGGRVMIINGVATMVNDDQVTGATFMRLAQRLDDPDLALQFARGWFRASVDMGGVPQGLTDIHTQCVGLLTEEHQVDFNRFVGDLLKEKPRRLATHCGLLSRVGEMLGENLLDIDELLAAIDESGVAVGWALPTVEFLAAIPEPSRPTALRRAIENAPEGRRVHALFVVPFNAPETLPPDLAAVVRDYFAGDLRKAKETGMLDYILNTIPPSAELLTEAGNADLAIDMLERLRENIPSKERDAIDAMTALMLRQAGRRDEAVAITLELRAKGDPPQDAYAANNARRNLFAAMMKDAPDAFLAAADEKAAAGGASVESTDERIALVRELQDPDRLRAEYAAAIERHPDEKKYVSALESIERRAGRLRNAIALNERLHEGLRNQEEAPPAVVTRDMIIDLMVENALSRSRGNVPADVYRQSYERMADRMSLQQLEQQAERMGISLPGGTAMKIAEIERRLGQLWGRLGNPARSLPYWTSVEAHDRERLAEAKAKVEAGESISPDEPEVATAPAIGGTVAAMRLVPAAAASSGVVLAAAGPAGEPEADAKDSMLAVRKAVDAGGAQDARQTLRRLWRQFPSDDTSRMIYRPVSSMVALTWPTDEEMKAVEDSQADEPAEPPEEGPTDAEKAEQRAKARKAARGGINAIVRPTERERTERESAWKVLAEYPFGIDEMQRVVRSRSANEVRTIKPVVLGLLEAARSARGDEVVRRELLDDVAADRAGQKSLIQLFALLNESPELIGPDDKQVLDDLLRVIEPREVRLLSRLAWLYAAIGARDEAAILYEFCAGRVGTTSPMNFGWNPFASDQSVDLGSLVGEIREHYTGDELIDLLDRVFDAVTGLAQNEGGLRAAVETYTELLGAEEAAARLGGLFEDVERADLAHQRGIASLGVELFVGAGRYDDARRCLRAAVRSYRPSDLPQMMRYRFGRTERITFRPNNEMLLDLFPEDPSAVPDARAWLESAHAEYASLLEADLVSMEFAVRPLALIAVRLAAIDAMESAQAVASLLLDGLGDLDSRDRLLVLDAGRAALLAERSVGLATALYEGQTLPVARYADLVYDTLAVDGMERAEERFEELASFCSDEELLAAGIALAEMREDLERVAALQDASAEMLASREARTEVLRSIGEIAKELRELEESDADAGKGRGSRTR